MEETSIKEEKVVFKQIKRKGKLRRRVSEDEEEEKKEKDEDEADLLQKLEETKLLQQLRKRPTGISAEGLASGDTVPHREGLNKDGDLFKLKAGGMINMGALKGTDLRKNDDPYDTTIGTQFSAETNKRDEDEEMMKYIDDQLAKIKGSENSESNSADPNKYLSPEEAALQSLPDHLRQSSTHRSEEMLSNQMLSGIPEVDLGIEAKIKNIEATEDAKLKLIRDRKNRQDGPSQFVPANMAVNFVQHDRFNIDSEPPRKKKVAEKVEEKVIPEKVVNKSDKKDKGEKATDDYHYEKFKKQFRRF